jgi:hypothetical protein
MPLGYRIDEYYQVSWVISTAMHHSDVSSAMIYIPMIRSKLNFSAGFVVVPLLSSNACIPKTNGR